MFQSNPFSLICFGMKLAIDNGRMTKVCVMGYSCNKQINLVLTGNIEKRNDLFKKFVKSAIFFHLDIKWMIWNQEYLMLTENEYFNSNQDIMY